MEINVDETLFTLHISPYYLRLNFPRALQEGEDASSARYDPGSGYLTVTLTKAMPGEDFEDMDLLAKLLAPRRSETVPRGPLIEVVGSQEGVFPDDELTARAAELSLDEREFLEGMTSQ